MTVCATWIAYVFYRLKNPFGVAVFGAMAVLFNPIAKIHMERDIHAILNVVTAVILVIGLWVGSRGKQEETDNG